MSKYVAEYVTHFVIVYQALDKFLTYIKYCVVLNVQEQD